MCHPVIGLAYVTYKPALTQVAAVAYRSHKKRVAEPPFFMLALMLYQLPNFLRKVCTVNNCAVASANIEAALEYSISLD